jgi:very-short-patch-repair endonuclease
MYADLDNGMTSLASSPVIQALAGDPSALPPEPSGILSPQEYDSKLRPEDSFQVLDADSSQQEAVQAALAGVSFVLQGPPGTGKSQTITNMMAELMARGKRILFVSQKMAALDVVKGNLVKCGLGDRCLELHDPKRNRAEIVKDIAASLENVNATSAPNEVRDLAAVRQELADYVRALHAPRGRLQDMSVFRMIGSYSSYPDAIDLNFHLPCALEVDDERLGRMDASVHRLSQMSSAFYDTDHPWSGAIVTDWSDRLQAKVLEELTLVMEARDKLLDAALSATQALQLHAPEDLSDLRRMRQLYRDLADRPVVRRDWLEGDLDLLVRMAEEGSAAFGDLTAHEKGLLGMGSRDILDLDGRTFRHRFEVEYSGALRAINSGYRRDMKILRAISGRTMSYDEARTMLAAVDRYQRSLASWKMKREGLLTTLRGSFTGDGNELPALAERLNWARRFRTNHAILMNGTVMDALTVDQLPSAVKDSSVDLEMYLGRFDSALNVLSTRFIPEFRLNGRPLKDAALNDIRTWTDKAWEGRYRYQQWLDLSSLITGMRALGLGDLLRELREKRLPAEDMMAGFQKRFRRLWTEEALASEPALNRFRRDHQTGLIERFDQLDQLYIERSRPRVQARILENTRIRREGPDRNMLLKQETEIARLAKLKRQRKAVRNMLSECWDLIGLVKPCILMSPLSVSQFLDRERTRFDVVIFDEASQICPEDAIGAIARGRQLIVVGDSRQMPPTSFFAMSAEDEDQEPDLESILDECETCGMSRRMLMWHYRSRDESLIAFSNYQFYGGRLNTFPSPLFGREGFGVHHVHVPNGVFDRGKSRTNREEARVVANMVREHYAKKENGSLGVIAFSEAQMEAVDQELNELRRNDRHLDEILSSEEGEPFLLYNLENVQGHERDRIILSVGYGRDENGKFLLNLGPLNKDGGERRLNVAITRAKRSLDIVSSVRSEDIDLSGSKSTGARLLKQYLAFAEAGGDRRALPLPPGRSLEVASAFEEQLGRALEARGHKVKRDVGTSEYRVDLAIEDPEEPGRFLLGIECDGAHYLSGRTVRDRDRTRQNQLKRLGWKLHRVWSTEWFRNPQGELDRVEEALRSVRKLSG